ncbi:hypothetical protein X546_04600 [Brevibacillus borstelensis cifa_chp40]|nr:hypothetical protein X546_04600 [Brevibacillus borstelensis cifa_chp40]
MEMAGDFLGLLIDQLVQDERLVKKLEARLAEVRPDQNRQIDSCLTVAEASEYTKIPVKMLYTMCQQRTIPHFRSGKKNSKKARIYFVQSELDKWMAAGGVER